MPFGPEAETRRSRRDRQVQKRGLRTKDVDQLLGTIALERDAPHATSAGVVVKH